MRLLGVVSVIIGCGIFGLVRAFALKKRAECLASAMDALRYMGSELRASSPTLPELIGDLAQSSGSGVKGLFAGLYMDMAGIGQESFESLWTRAVMEERTLALDKDQRRLLAGAGTFMGKFSSEEQAQALEHCARRLETEYRRAEEAAKDGRRLYPGLGLTAGIMLAAVLL